MNRPKFTIHRGKPRTPPPAPAEPALPPPAPPSRPVPKCEKCGVFVIDTVVHEAWHEREELRERWQAKIHRHVKDLLEATGLRITNRGNTPPTDGDT